MKAGLGLSGGIAVTGMSGVSGAGRKASEDYSFVEVADDLRAYRIGKHQHVPEIEQTVARFAGACGPISFTPILTPIRRGILATIAKQERIRLSERTIAGLEKARKQGRVGGRPRVVVNRAKVVEMDADGMTMREIADDLGISAASVCRILKGNATAA